jgi:hypothetical protein
MVYINTKKPRRENYHVQLKKENGVKSLQLQTDVKERDVAVKKPKTEKQSF